MLFPEVHLHSLLAPASGASAGEQPFPWPHLDILRRRGFKPAVPDYLGNAETPDLSHLEAPIGTFPAVLSLTLPEFSPAKIVIALEKESRQSSLSGSLEGGKDVLS